MSKQTEGKEEIINSISVGRPYLMRDISKVIGLSVTRMCAVMPKLVEQGIFTSDHAKNCRKYTRTNKKYEPEFESKLGHSNFQYSVNPFPLVPINSRVSV